MSQQPYYNQSPNPGPYASGPTPRDPHLDQPWYGIGFWPAVKRVFSKYATFSGRASRGEFWWFYLFNGIIGVGVSILMLIGGINWSYIRYSYTYGDYYSYYGPFALFTGFGSFLYGLDILYGLAVLVPSLAVAVRRLHDIGKSGAWWCVIFIPLAGPIWWLILMATPTYPGTTQWDVPVAYAQPGYPAQGPGYPPPANYPPPPGFSPQGPYPPNYPPQGYPPQEGWR